MQDIQKGIFIYFVDTLPLPQEPYYIFYHNTGSVFQPADHCSEGGGCAAGHQLRAKPQGQKAPPAKHHCPGDELHSPLGFGTMPAWEKQHTRQELAASSQANRLQRLVRRLVLRCCVVQSLSTALQFSATAWDAGSARLVGLCIA